MKDKPKSKRGFAAMSHAMKMKICRMGGMAISQNSAHMAKIGRIGGKNSHRGDPK